MIVSTAEYFEHRARPAHMPVPSHQPQAAQLSERNAATRQTAAPSRAASSGPSGNTQLALVMPKSGVRFSTTAAQKPASGLNKAEVRRYIRNVVTAKSAINGSRTTIGLSLPVKCAAAQAIHHAIGGWSK